MARKTDWERMFAVGLVISIYMVAIFFVEWMVWFLVTLPFALINPIAGTIVGWVLMIVIFILNRAERRPLNLLGG